MIKLLCCTYAGGAADFFEELRKRVLPEIELIAIDYPGHGKRRKDSIPQSIDELVGDMYDHFKMHFDGKYALLGYSMGSLIAVKILEKIVINGDLLPRHLFVAAHESVVDSRLLSAITEMKLSGSEDKIREHTVKYGGIPEKLIGNEAFWRLYMPIYISDYTFITQYVAPTNLSKGNVSATILYSLEEMNSESAAAWEATLGKCNCIGYKGQHFFIKEHYDEIADVIKETLSEF